MTTYNVLELSKMPYVALVTLAAELGIEQTDGSTQNLIYKILDAQAIRLKQPAQ